MGNTPQGAHWRAALWDTPKNGARYCVKRPDAEALNGWEYLGDGHGRVTTFGSRAEAERAAKDVAEGREVSA